MVLAAAVVTLVLLVAQELQVKAMLAVRLLVDLAAAVVAVQVLRVVQEQVRAEMAVLVHQVA